MSAELTLVQLEELIRTKFKLPFKIKINQMKEIGLDGLNALLAKIKQVNDQNREAIESKGRLIIRELATYEAIVAAS
jgi:hypothetical protein